MCQIGPVMWFYLSQLSYPAQSFILTLTEDDLMGRNTSRWIMRLIREKNYHFYCDKPGNHLCFFLVPLYSAIRGDQLQDLDVKKTSLYDGVRKWKGLIDTAVSHLWVFPSVLPQTTLHPHQPMHQLLFGESVSAPWWFLGLALDVRRGIVCRGAGGVVLRQRGERVAWRAPHQVVFGGRAEEVFRPAGAAADQRLHGGNFELQPLGKWLGFLFLLGLRENMSKKPRQWWQCL